MTGHTVHEAIPRFGGAAPPEVDRRLRDAAGVDASRAETLLLDAQRIDPECLPVCFALYKFYFYRSRLADAERAALHALETAARQGRFPADWTALTPEVATWADAQGPARFYLFSLKALALIRLRQGRVPEARALLDKLAELDPLDQVGASVINSLATATAGAA